MTTLRVTTFNNDEKIDIIEVGPCELYRKDGKFKANIQFTLDVHLANLIDKRGTRIEIELKED